MMAPTSHLLAQHIGELEEWVSTVVVTNPCYRELTSLDCVLTDGVLLYDKESGVTFTPDSMSAHFVDTTDDDAERILRIARVYMEMLRVLDSTMVQYAAELEDRRRDLELASARETLYAHGFLWMRHGRQVTKVKVVSISGKGSGMMVDYTEAMVLKPVVKTISLRYAEFFIKREDAYNPTKEGYHV